MRTTAMVFGLLVLSTGLSAQTPSAEEYRATTKPMIACPSLERYDAQRAIAATGQADAWVAFLEKAECRRVRALVDVIVAEISRRPDVVCVKSMVPPDEDGWVGCLYASKSEVRRIQEDT